MPCKTMNSARELENQHMLLEASPRPYSQVDPHDHYIAYPNTKKAKNMLNKRTGIYRDRHKAKKEVYDEVSAQKYVQEVQDTHGLVKKYQETKAKKTKKEKGEKNAKKNDVLSVSLINDENRSMAYQRPSNVPSVNQSASPSNSLTPAGGLKSDQFDRDLPSAASEHSHTGSIHDALFTNGFLTLDNFPDLLAGSGASLDELLPNDDPSGGLHSLDVGHMLDGMNSELSDEFRQHVDSLDNFSPETAYFPGGAGRTGVKLESSPPFLDGFASDATGSPFSTRSAHATVIPGINGPPVHTSSQHNPQHLRITPDHVRGGGVGEVKQRLDEHQQMMMAQQQQQQHHNNMLRQQQVMQQYQQKTNSSPFTGTDSQQQQPPVGMCFSPGSSQAPSQQDMGYPPGAYPGPGRQAFESSQTMSRQGQQQQQQPPPPPHQVMRMSQSSSPGAAGVGLPNGGGGPGRWVSEPMPTLTFHQQKQMSLANGTDLTYGGGLGPAGQMTSGVPGKQVFHQGAQGYPQNQMLHRQAQGPPVPYYVNGGPGSAGGGGSMPRPPSQQQYRAMMQNGQPVTMNGKMYPSAGPGAARSPYGSSAGHMAQPHQPTTVYQSNVHNPMEQPAGMRQMTGYRPAYAQTQPVPIQHQQQQQPTFLTSATALQQQQHQQQAQQPPNFYPQSQNGFPGPEQMNYGQNLPDGMYPPQWAGI